MNSPNRKLGLERLPFCLLVSCCGILGLGTAPAVSQSLVDLTNTAAANFRIVPNGPPRGATSNTTIVPAQLIGPPKLEIEKSGDRVVAEPGDTIVYRLVVKNTGEVPALDVTVQDTLPLGFQYVPRTFRASLATSTGITDLTNLPTPTTAGRTVNFSYPGSLTKGETLTLIYGALLTPDAIRGTGRNLAVAQGFDPLGRGPFVSNTASYQLQVRRGILSDCGTILGRVFVDKNFDGEQQPGEPGVPNAVIYMDDGNRITTDNNGLFSLLYVLPGQRVGTLDLESLPGYTIAPNLYRKEGNSASRLVPMAPGVTRRMNFAVTPSFGEGK
jgi:uncharacterized repeat protein (TIGR01451 family)